MIPEPRVFTEAERMELRSYVQLAGEVVSPYWPMRTFIHHNPLHGLEELPFGQAVKRGERLLGGKGYLSNQAYRRYFDEGRISNDDLLEVLAPIATDKRVVFGGRELSHLELLRLSMVHGLGEAAASSTPEQRQTLEPLLPWLTACLTNAPSEYTEPLTPWEAIDLLSNETLAAWCDRTLGTSLVADINDQMIKWCSVFLDEGEASWSMPDRDHTFFRSWKRLVRYDASLRLLGMTDVAKKLEALDDRPEVAILQSVAALAIPKSAWEAYFALHLAALPGWTGYIKWRVEEQHHPWQARYPVDLVKYLAVRLFYERELVEVACRGALSMSGDYESIRTFSQQAPYAHWLRRHMLEGRLPAEAVREVRVWSRRHAAAAAADWNGLGRQLHEETAQWRLNERVAQRAATLIDLAAALDVPQEHITLTATGDVATLCDWLDGFPPMQHGPRWLEAMEARHRREIVRDLSGAVVTGARMAQAVTSLETSRPLAQMVFCIDVRSEVFRRHLEQLGGYETLGIAGFFGVPVKYQPFGGEHPVTHAPVLLKPKNHIREIPRSYHGAAASRHRFFGHLAKAGHTLLHDLKQNVVTPYVMVEAVGWIFGLPLLGKTLCPVWYQRLSGWFKQWWLPPLATTLTIDKLTRQEAEDIVAADQRAMIRAELRRAFPSLGSAVTPALIEMIRRRTLGDAGETERGALAETLGTTPAEEEAFYDRLRRQLDITPRGISNRLQRITQHGFSISEQAYAVEAALRLMGLTGNFARLVVICAHGSTSDNNPYESALDCGACGGNSGLPNARAFAAMANNRSVRETLQGRGITIPSDTHFVAARHDTTSDEIHIVDLEDVPPTHRKDLVRLLADLGEAGEAAARERGTALDGSPSVAHGRVRKRAYRRSVDWAQVRPEWGLSRNNVLVIGRRDLTRPLNLSGRSFLHSYDHREDESGKLLETIMTAPLIVAQWINMEHYFSTVDNEVYGSGSKVYHNVVGRVGVMSGAASDIRLGLPAQTVLNGPVAYHEPTRLLTIIEAPRSRIESIIAKHPVLERLIHNEWVSLLAFEPEERICYRHDIMAGWRPLLVSASETHGRLRGEAVIEGNGAGGQPVRDTAGVSSRPQG
jgi:uncharacterized protein YbcC (UPF0753/DUF2309 family)